MAPGVRTYRVAAIDAAGNVSAEATAVVTVPTPAPAGLTARYYDTASFGTLRTTRVDPQVDFGWGTGRPTTAVAPDTFSVRWTGRVIPPADGTWTFVTQSDDGVRLWVDGRLVVSNWTTHTLTENRGSIVAHRRPGPRHPARVLRPDRQRDDPVALERARHHPADRPVSGPPVELIAHRRPARGAAAARHPHAGWGGQRRSSGSRAGGRSSSVASRTTGAGPSARAAPSR